MMEEEAKLEEQLEVESSTANIGVWNDLGLNFDRSKEETLSID
jgi:hypothetical protein